MSKFKPLELEENRHGRRVDWQKGWDDSDF
jgi:hypothetical protein